MPQSAETAAREFRTLREWVGKSLKDALRRAPGRKFVTNDGTSLPDYLKCSGPRRTLQEVASDWLEEFRLAQRLDRLPSRPIAVVSAPIGGGKTIATCHLAETLQERNPADLVVWTALGANEHYIWSDEIRQADCVILDAVDEYLYNWHSMEFDHRRLHDMLRARKEGGRPTIISCRDYQQAGTYVTGWIRDMVGAISNDHAAVWELDIWDDTLLRGELAARLRSLPQMQRPGADPALVDRQIERLRSGVLQNRLLYGLALDTFTSEIENASGGVYQISTPRQLTAEWVTAMINRHVELQARQLLPGGREACRHLAQDIALSAALAGSSQIPVEAISNSNWVRQPPARTGRDRAAGNASGPDERIREDLFRSTLLAHSGDGRTVSFLHDQILIHLASERLD